MQKEKLVFDFEVKQVGEGIDGFVVFEGYASTFGNLDLVADRIEVGAFKESIEHRQRVAKPVPDAPSHRALLPMLWGHNGWDPTIGVFIELREDDVGLFVKGIMPLSDDFVKGRIKPQMGAGGVTKMSIGFYARDWSMEDQEGGRRIRVLKKIELVEVSLVTFPANPQAAVTGFKSVVPFADLPVADVSVPWDAKAGDRLAEWKRHDATGWGAAHLYVAEGDDGLPEHRLPIADIVKGRMMVVPRALQIASVKLVIEKDVAPITAMAAIRQNIDRYYIKTGREPLFGDGRELPRLDELDAFGQKDVEAFFIRAGYFNRPLAKAVTSRIAGLLRDEDGHARRDDEPSAAQLEGLGAAIARLTKAATR